MCFLKELKEGQCLYLQVNIVLQKILLNISAFSLKFVMNFKIDQYDFGLVMRPDDFLDKQE